MIQIIKNRGPLPIERTNVLQRRQRTRRNESDSESDEKWDYHFYKVYLKSFLLCFNSWWFSLVEQGWLTTLIHRFRGRIFYRLRTLSWLPHRFRRRFLWANIISSWRLFYDLSSHRSVTSRLLWSCSRPFRTWTWRIGTMVYSWTYRFNIWS